MIDNTLLPNAEIFSVGHFRVGFGYRDLDLAELEKFSRKKICLLKQVHGDELVYASPSQIQTGDAQWSQEKDHLLVIKTADCQPLLMWDSNTQSFAAIHAGWRGVEQQITLKTLRRLSWNPQGVRVFVGPHILMQSFEVQENVARSLVTSNSMPCATLETSSSLLLKFKEFQSIAGFDEDQWILKKGDKYHLNLYLMTLWQLYQFGILPEQVKLLERDTMSDERYWSYRRDKHKERPDGSLRNYSFIYYSSQP